MKTDQISAELTSENRELALKKLDEIEALLPFLISLTGDELQGFLPGDVNVGWLAKTKDYMDQAPQFAPKYIDSAESKKDLSLTADMSVITKKTAILLEKMQNTFSQVGYEALIVALAYYQGVQRAAENNVPGAKTIYDDLKKRFTGRKKKNPPPK